ncbi:YegP family protein [Haloferula sp.]|uniref:YegP family protein n=1 Tax=Haloferula sp. TaxID=2497595 RepID=UPI003C77ABD7
MAIGYYELKRGVKHSFNLKAANHQVILTSQTYESKAAAENGIESVRKHGGDEGNFERKTAKSDQPYFVLKASNGQIIGTSEMYESAAARDNGIESVKSNSPSTEVKDLT